MRHLSTTLLAIAAMAFALPSMAATNYGDLPGDTMTFYQVTEDSMTDPLPLYGTPSVVGDTLKFPFVAFASFSAGAGKSDSTIGTLATTIQAVPGSYVGIIEFAEYGDVSLSGTGTTATYATVSNSIFIDVLEIDEIPVTDDISFAAYTSFTPSNGDWDLFHDGKQTGTLWQGVLYLDVDAALEGLGYSGHATKLDLVMTNTNATGSESGTSAFIRKKETDGIMITPMEDVIIPEPGTLLIFAAGALLTLIRRRNGA